MTNKFTLAILTAGLIAGGSSIAFAQASGGTSNSGNAHPSAAPSSSRVNGQTIGGQNTMNNQPCGTGSSASTATGSGGLTGSSTSATGMGSTTTANTNESAGTSSSTPNGLSTGTTSGSTASGC